MRTMSYSAPDRPRRLRAALTVLLAGSLFLSACSTEADDATDAATDTAAAQGAGADAAGDGATGSGGGEEVADAGDFCETMRTQVRESALMNGESPDSIEDVDAMVRQASEVYSDLSENAPDEIADDVAVIADSFARQMEALDNLDNAQAAADMVDTLSSDFIEAQSRVMQWELENC